MVAIAMVTACSTIQRAEEAVADAEQQSTDTRVFPIDASQTRQVILDSIEEGWPDKSPEPIGDGRLGYEFTLRFAIDRERIIVEGMPEADGHFFRVTNRGTAPAVGVPARNKLVPLLEKNAQASGS